MTWRDVTLFVSTDSTVPFNALLLAPYSKLLVVSSNKMLLQYVIDSIKSLMIKMNEWIWYSSF